MATIEELMLARDFLQNLHNLRRDMRRNAESYKVDLESGRLSLEKLTAVIQADANEYVTRRLGQYCNRILDDPMLSAKLISGLAAQGLTLAEILAARAELEAAAQQLLGKPVSTPADVSDAADDVLARVTKHETVW